MSSICFYLSLGFISWLSMTRVLQHPIHMIREKGSAQVNGRMNRGGRGRGRGEGSLSHTTSYRGSYRSQPQVGHLMLPFMHCGQAWHAPSSLSMIHVHSMGRPCLVMRPAQYSGHLGGEKQGRCRAIGPFQLPCPDSRW